MFVICDHAGDCTNDKCSYRHQHPGDTFNGHCGTIKTFVEIIRYSTLGKDNPNVVFERKNHGH